MKRQPLRNPSRFFALWMVLLAVCVACIVLLNVKLARYAEESRRTNPETYLAAARERVATGDIPGAYAELDKAVECDRGSGLASLAAGDICLQMKQWERALWWYDHALDLGCQHPGLRTNRLWALIELGQYQEAVEFGNKSIEEGFSAPLIPRYVAEAYLRNGDQVQAIPYLEKAIEGNPNDLYILEQLRIGYEQAGNAQRAQEVRDLISDVQTAINAAPTGGP